jgi:hypothetical protein
MLPVEVGGEPIMSSRRFLLITTGAFVCAAMAGCASESSTRPTDELTKAHTVVEQADKGGTAQRYAAADLQRAHDELSDADRFNAQRKYTEARAYAQRAEVDADLAVARGNSAEQQKAAEDVMKSNRALEQESQRGGNASDTGTSPPSH